MRRRALSMRPSAYDPLLRLHREGAERGWIYHQHTLTSAEDDVAISEWERINQTVPIAPLNWSVAHAVTITPQNLQRLRSVLTIVGGRVVHGTGAVHVQDE